LTFKSWGDAGSGEMQSDQPNSKENGSPEGKPLTYLVAGEGFEPSTFGL
jgi:hypothetical protein